MERTTGQVKWFDEQKGYGFIESDEFDEDLFVHFSDIDSEGFKTLDENDRIEFEAEESEDGLQAKTVIKIG